MIHAANLHSPGRVHRVAIADDGRAGRFRCAEFLSLSAALAALQRWTARAKGEALQATKGKPYTGNPFGPLREG